jgi:hypothetical protein
MSNRHLARTMVMQVFLPGILTVKIYRPILMSLLEIILRILLLVLMTMVLLLGK